MKREMQFSGQKSLKLTPKMTKDQKFPDFNLFYANFVTFSIDFVD